MPSCSAEAIPQIVWKADPVGHVNYFNQRWYDYSGQPVTEALGTAWTGVLHPDDAETIGGRWTEALEHPKVFELECRLRGRDGSYRWFLCRAVPELTDDGRTIGWLGNFRRLTVRYERLLATYGGFFHLACALLVLRRVLK